MTPHQSIPALEPNPPVTPGCCASNTPPAQKRQPDPVQQSSEESFPASDPPAHSGVRPAPKTEKPADPAANVTSPPLRETLKPDKVTEASDESFPASDPPAWGSSHA